MSNINASSGPSLVALASVLAIAITQNLTVDEMNSLGNFLTALSDNILLIADQQEP